MVQSPRRKPPTIKDVAERAGVSFQTVSFVLNNRPRISDETREKVRRAIDELGYTPNPVARGLRLGRTRAIGMVVPTILDFYYVDLIRGAEDAAARSGHIVSVASSEFQVEREREHIRAFHFQRVAGVILASGENDDEHIKELRSAAIPVVVVDQSITNRAPEVPYVGIDNVLAMQRATSYLLELGHRRIAYVTEPLVVQSLKDRLRGYQLALKEHGVGFDPSLVHLPEEMRHTKIEAGYRAALMLLDLPAPPSAIIAVSDMAAMGVLRAAHDRGVAVPGTLSVVGFDDLIEAAYSVPRLTTVRQPKHDMGSIAVDLLLRIRAGEELQIPNVIMESELMTLDSCAPYQGT
jgi:DNA-binding LacI/PurR family transcriptional regulator